MTLTKKELERLEELAYVRIYSFLHDKEEEELKALEDKALQ